MQDENDNPLAQLECALPDGRWSEDGIKLAFGEDGDKVIRHVSEVAKGAACGCICPACRQPLIARKGPRVADHFAHRPDSNCQASSETVIHLYAKRLLDQRRRFWLPAVEAEDGDREFVLYRMREREFDSAVLEHKLGDIKPDLIVKMRERELLVGSAGVTGPSAAN
jgi:hypothetical protein